MLYDKYVDKDGRKGYHWQEVAVVLVQDGIGMVSEDVLASATVQGFFSPVILQDQVLGMPVNAHVFEYTARCGGGARTHPPFQTALPLTAAAAGCTAGTRSTRASRTTRLYK